MAWRDSSAFCAAVAGAARGRFVMRRRLLQIDFSLRRHPSSVLSDVHCFPSFLPFLGLALSMSATIHGDHAMVV